MPPSPDPTLASGASTPRSQLTSHRYGKSRVRLLRVTRHGTHHDIDDWTVALRLTGDFTEAFTAGDNSRLLATDTMKNMVYVHARRSHADSMEAFAQELIGFILDRNPQVTGAEVTVASHLWKRLTIDGQPHPTAFMKGSAERQTCTLAQTRGDAFTGRSGFDGMTVLKTAQSGFAGFLRDEFTTLPDTTDRLFGTEIKADWTYTAAGLAAGFAFNDVRQHLRERLVTTFAQHISLSVQQTLYAMAEAALEHTPLLDEITLSMPNKHNLLVDLSRFGLDNPNHIFVPTEEPHGTIEATVRRA